MGLKTVERPRLSSEPIRVPIFAEVNGAVFVPTAMTVEMAFIPYDPNAIFPGVEPTPTDWTAGLWDVDASSATVVYRAQVKPPTLVKNTYTVWLRLSGTDVPVRVIGILKLV